MKKVLYITNIPAPYKIDFLNELGKKVDLTVLFEAKGASDQGINFNWNLDSIKNFKAFFLNDNDIRESIIDWKIIKYLKNNSFDEYIITNYAYLTEMIALIYLKIKRKVYSYILDGAIIRKENILKKHYKSFLIKGAKRYFSPGKKTDEFLNSYGVAPEKITRYPFSSLHNCDILERPITANIKTDIKNELGIPQKIMLLGVGQFIHRKGWDVLINSLEFINSDVEIYIIGGECTREYSEIINSKNISNVHFLNFLGTEILKKYYCAADLFVLPTREDIWGLVINEAMAAACPIVTTNKCIAGLELVKDGKNGYIVPPDDFHALADKINYILTSHELKNSMSTNSLSVIRDYTIENMGNIVGSFFL